MRKRRSHSKQDEDLEKRKMIFCKSWSSTHWSKKVLPYIFYRIFFHDIEKNDPTANGIWCQSPTSTPEHVTLGKPRLQWAPAGELSQPYLLERILESVINSWSGKCRTYDKYEGSLGYTCHLLSCRLSFWGNIFEQILALGEGTILYSGQSKQAPIHIILTPTTWNFYCRYSTV